LETCDGELEILNRLTNASYHFYRAPQTISPSIHTNTLYSQNDQTPPPAQPQLEKGFHAVQDAGHRVAEAAKPALQQAGEAIKSTSQHVVDKLQGKGGEGGGGAGGQPPHTV
jgi:hypothetical protein